MKTRHKKSYLLMLGAGVALSCAAATASADIAWVAYPGITNFEDDNFDFHYDRVQVDPECEVDCETMLVPTTDYTLDVGDVLIAVLDITTAGGEDIPPQDLTGISAVQVQSINGLDVESGIAGRIEYTYVTEGLDYILGLGGIDPLQDGLGDAGSTVAMWLDDVNDLHIAGDDITADSVSCDSLTECMEQATNGDLFQVDGFADPDDRWFANGSSIYTGILLETPIETAVGVFNFYQSILYNGTGVDLVYQGLDCPTSGLNPLHCGTGAGADGLVDLRGSGEILGSEGVSANLIADGLVATSDFQFAKRQAVPEPGVLALFSIGLLGMGSVRRFGKKKTS